MSVQDLENPLFDVKLYHPLVYFAIALPILGKYLPGSVTILSSQFGWTRLGTIFVAVLALISVVNGRKVSLTYLDIGLIIILVSFITSVFWSITPTGSWIAANNYLFHILYLGSVIIFLNSERELTDFAYYLSFIAFVIAIIGLISILTGSTSRFIVGGVTYNSFSRDLIALFPVLTLMAFRFRKNRLLNILSTGIMIVLIPLSGSRSGVAGLAVATVLIMAFYILYLSDLPNVSTIFVAITTLVIGALLLRLGISAGIFGQRLLRIPLTPGELFSPEILGERYVIYQTQVGVIADNWLYGIGFAAFFNEYEFMTHNPFTRIWLATGIFPLLIFVTIYLQSLRQYLAAFVKKKNPIIIGFLIGLLGLTAAGFFNIMMNQPIFYLYFAVGSHTCARILDE